MSKARIEPNEYLDRYLENTLTDHSDVTFQRSLENSGIDIDRLRKIRVPDLPFAEFSNKEKLQLLHVLEQFMNDSIIDPYGRLKNHIPLLSIGICPLTYGTMYKYRYKQFESKFLGHLNHVLRTAIDDVCQLLFLRDMKYESLMNKFRGVIYISLGAGIREAWVHTWALRNDPYLKEVAEQQLYRVNGNDDDIWVFRSAIRVIWIQQIVLSLRASICE